MKNKPSIDYVHVVEIGKNHGPNYGKPGDMGNIKTTYNGINYRSRLEAKWAYMFDAFHWKFQYEPFDLNGWIPDFVLFGAREEILVEVKPISRLIYFNFIKLEDALKGSEHFGKDILILGTKPEGIKIGWLFEGGYGIEEDDSSLLPGYAEGDGLINKFGGVFGLIHDHQSYRDRITGLHDGDHCVDVANSDEIDFIWKQACNTVQWCR